MFLLDSGRRFNRIVSFSLDSILQPVVSDATDHEHSRQVAGAKRQQGQLGRITVRSVGDRIAISQQLEK